MRRLFYIIYFNTRLKLVSMNATVVLFIYFTAIAFPRLFVAREFNLAERLDTHPALLDRAYNRLTNEQLSQMDLASSVPEPRLMAVRNYCLALGCVAMEAVEAKFSYNGSC